MLNFLGSFASVAMMVKDNNEIIMKTLGKR